MHFIVTVVTTPKTFLSLAKKCFSVCVLLANKADNRHKNDSEKNHVTYGQSVRMKRCPGVIKIIDLQ